MNTAFKMMINGILAILVVTLLGKLQYNSCQRAIRATTRGRKSKAKQKADCKQLKDKMVTDKDPDEQFQKTVRTY